MWKTAAYRGTLATSYTCVQEQNKRLLLSLSSFTGHFTASTHLGEESHFIKNHITQEQQSASHLFPDLPEALQWCSELEELLAMGILISRARILFSLGRNLFCAATTGNFFSKWQQLWSWLGLQAQMHVLIEIGSSASTDLTVLQFRYCSRASVELGSFF